MGHHENPPTDTPRPEPQGQGRGVPEIVKYLEVAGVPGEAIGPVLVKLKEALHWLGWAKIARERGLLPYGCTGIVKALEEARDILGAHGIELEEYT